MLVTRSVPNYPPIARAARISGQVAVEFLINDKGETASVAATDGPAMLRKSAEDFVKGWKFDLSGAAWGAETRYVTKIEYKIISGATRPSDGPNLIVHADSFHHFDVTVLVADVFVDACPKGADADVPAEVAKDDYVEMSRSGCYGSCPEYTVKVRADGKVAWDGGSYVEAKGKQESSIDSKAARDLLERFRSKDFWSYCRDYSRSVTDMSGSSVTVRLGGKIRKISDYADSSPQALRDLLLDVDRVADSHRWRHGDPAKEPITRIDSDAYLPKPGVTPLMLAAAWNKVERLKALIDAAADLKETDASGWSALMYAAAGPQSDALQILLKAGADPNQSSPHGDTPLMASCASGSWDGDLVTAGAKVNAQNKDGQTALMFLAARDEVDEIRDALKAGANPVLKDVKGRSALDYLRLASCGKSPIYDPITDGIYSYRKCTAFDADDLRKAETLLRDAMRLAK